MTLDELKIRIYTIEDSTGIVFYYNDPDIDVKKFLNLEEIEDFIKQLSVAAAKIRAFKAKP